MRAKDRRKNPCQSIVGGRRKGDNQPAWRINDKELGACADCSCYRPFGPHFYDTDRKLTGISCRQYSGLVSPRTDIMSRRECTKDTIQPVSGLQVST